MKITYSTSVAAANRIACVVDSVAVSVELVTLGRTSAIVTSGMITDR